MKQYKQTPYLVSEDGLVYRKGKPNPLKPDVSSSGYYRVSLSIDGKVQRLLVHRMVAEVFIENLTNLPDVNHKDNNPSNNSMSNLEWVTHSQNMLHCHKQGRCSNLVASAKASAAKLKQSSDFFSKLLGEQFIAVVNENPRNKVVYSCPFCSKQVTSRTDSSVFKKEVIGCNSCMRKMKI